MKFALAYAESIASLPLPSIISFFFSLTKSAPWLVPESSFGFPLVLRVAMNRANFMRTFVTSAARLIAKQRFSKWNQNIEQASQTKLTIQFEML